MDSREIGHLPPIYQRKTGFKLNLFLFLVTIASTVIAGALQEGVNPLKNLPGVIKGIPFAFSLMSILLSHELGHYLMSKKHGVKATLPYFIPAPSFIGTFGALIKMQSPVRDRKALLDIGAAGPLVGVAISIPFIIIGLRLSEVRVTEVTEGAMLGSSLLLSFLTHVTLGSLPENYSIIIHPMAFAGWIGLLVTSMNLLPVGQLDGGHVAYAIFGERQERLGRLAPFALMALGFFSWSGWFIWAILLMIMGPKHPPPLDFKTPLDKKRKIIGGITFVIFLLTFTPVPFAYL